MGFKDIVCRALGCCPPATSLPAPKPVPEPTPIPAPAPAPDKNDPYSMVLDLASYFVGIREAGSNRGPEVEMFQRVVGGTDDAPWCMSFVQWNVRRVAQLLKKTSKIHVSEHCLTVWNNTPASLKSQEISVGSIVIWQHANTTNGHTGFVKAILPNGKFLTVEGNTRVSGGQDGCYEMTRNLSGDGDMKIRGFIRAFG